MKAAARKTRKPAADSRMRQIEEFAREKGAYRVKTFPAKWVTIDDRVRMKCQIPLCPHYGKMLTCPPNIPTVEEFTKALARYEHALLVQTRSTLSGEIEAYEREQVIEFFMAPTKTAAKTKGGDSSGEGTDFNNVRLAAVRLHKLINEVEGRAMALGFPYALGLIGGECMLCTQCVGAGAEHGCRRPYEARPSMEGVGIDVIETSRKAGLPFEIPPKTEIVWSGLVLID